MTERPELKCAKCNYAWTPRYERTPKECPQCKNRQWRAPEDAQARQERES